MFTVRDRKRHREIRRLLAPYYRKEVVQGYEPLLEPCLEDLKRVLDNMAHFELEVDLSSLIVLFAFDAIGRVTVRKRRDVHIIATDYSR